MSDAIDLCISIVSDCIPYAVAFWVVRKTAGAILGAAFGGKMKL